MGSTKDFVIVAAVVALVLVVAIVSVVAVRVSRDRGADGGVGPLVETPVSMAGEVAVGSGAVWVLDHTDRKVLRIDAATGEVTGEVDIDRSRGLAAGDDAVWVGAHADGRADADVLLRLDPTTLATVAEVPLPAAPDVDAIAAGPNSVWVATRDAHVVQIDVASNEAVAEIAIQRAAWVGRYHVAPDRQLVGVDLCRVDSESRGVACAELASASTPTRSRSPRRSTCRRSRCSTWSPARAPCG